MATTMLPICPVSVRACLSTRHRKADVNNRRSSSSNWWSPLFGWSSEPDYIDTDNKRSDLFTSTGNKSELEPDPKPVATSRFTPGTFTAEKARQLRMMTTESSTFHDVMYHSAIASRLASDFSDRSDLKSRAGN